MVHKLPLFIYKAQFPPIQTNFPACSVAISGKNLELCSLYACFQSIKKFLETGSLKGFLSSKLSSSQGCLDNFLELAQDV